MPKTCERGHGTRTFELVTLFLFLVSAVCAAIAVVLWRRRATPGAVPLVVLLAAVAEWNLAYGLEIAADGLAAKLFWAKVQYIGIVAAPVAIFAFAAAYSGRRQWLSRRRLVSLSLIPAVTLGLALTHELHHLIWSSVESSGAGRSLALEHGPAFYPGWAWAYLLLFAASVLLVAAGVSARRYFRRQAVAVSVAVGTPWAANLAYVLGLAPDDFDITTIAFAVTALALALACIRWHLLEVMPVARDALVEHIRDAMMVLDDHGRVLDCNPAMNDLLACDVEDAIGRQVDDVLPAAVAAVCRVADGTATGEGAKVVAVDRQRERRVYEAQVIPLPGHGTRSRRRLLLHDVTAREALEAYLADQALTDDLTKVGNRRHFIDHTRRALIAASRGDESVAAIFIDINDFKSVNDTYGHDCGDAILIAAARRLEESIRPQDTVARLGGDEFAVLLGHIGDEAAAIEVSARIDAALRRPVLVGTRSVAVSASVGVYVARGDGETPESLLRHADSNMYAVKRGAQTDARTVKLAEGRQHATDAGAKSACEDAAAAGAARGWSAARALPWSARTGPR